MAIFCLFKSNLYFKKFPNLLNNSRLIFGFGKGREPKKTEIDDGVITELGEIDITEQVTKLESENLTSTNYNMNMLKYKRGLNAKKGYAVPSNVLEIIESVVVPIMGETDWQYKPLDNIEIKFEVLTNLISALDHDLPSCRIDEMTDVHQLLDYFTTPVRETSAYDRLAARGRKGDLPQNLHVQADYLRFDPETDTMFGGRTAFPGRDTVVASIKYSRKYKGTKGRTEKPGFVNHYEGY